MDLHPAPLRDVRRAVRVLHPRRVGRRPDVRRDLRLPRPASRQYAIDLGVALQLTNILRDVPGDLAQGRLYIPLEDLARTGAARTTCGRRSPTPAAACTRRPSGSCSRARRRGRATTTAAPTRALPRADARRLVAAEIMGAIYRGILDRIEAADYDVFSRVIRVPRRSAR